MVRITHSRPDGGFNRRRFLQTGAAAGLVTTSGLAIPGVSRAADRPVLTHGVQSGDVSVNSGVVWARADRPSRVFFDIATTDSFKDVRRSVFLDALPESDFAVKALIGDLPAGQDIFYRARVTDLAGGDARGGRTRLPQGGLRPDARNLLP